MAAGQTFTLIYRGQRLLVCEGQDGTLEFRMGRHRQTPDAKTFGPAVKEAVKFMLDNAGEIDESRYIRG